MSSPNPRGRPRADASPVDVDQLLELALKAFATHGYEGVSVRTLNRELGVSHSLIHQRFGSKRGLWKAAVDHAFEQQIATLLSAFDPAIDDPIAQLNHFIRNFLRYTAAHPELVGLMNIEAKADSDRLDYIHDTYVAPALRPLERLLERLAADGRIRPVSLRAFHMLIGHGGGALFGLAPFARRFGGPDPLDPDVVEEHATLVADVVTAGLVAAR